MPSFSKIPFTFSSAGRPISVASTGGAEAYTQIHTTGTATTGVDEVWVFATNTSSAAAVLTLALGATGSAYEVVQSIPATGGLTMVLPGTILTGTGSVATTALAKASAKNALSVVGYVNRIS